MAIFPDILLMYFSFQPGLRRTEFKVRIVKELLTSSGGALSTCTKPFKLMGWLNSSGALG
jgi:hypothetical protein